MGWLPAPLASCSCGGFKCPTRLPRGVLRGGLGFSTSCTGPLGPGCSHCIDSSRCRALPSPLSRSSAPPGAPHQTSQQGSLPLAWIRSEVFLRALRKRRLVRSESFFTCSTSTSAGGPHGCVALRLASKNLLAMSTVREVGPRGLVSLGKDKSPLGSVLPLTSSRSTPTTDSPPFLSLLQGRPGPPGMAGPQGEKVSRALG